MEKQMTDRPIEFDDRVMDYLPGLYAKAGRLVRPENRSELVQETLVTAFANWESFEHRGSNWEGLYTWLVFRMRGVTSRWGRKNARVEMLSLDAGFNTEDGDAENYLEQASTPPTQEEATEIALTLRNITKCMSRREGDVLKFRMMGHQMPEIAEIYGVSKQAIAKTLGTARGKLEAHVSKAPAARLT